MEDTPAGLRGGGDSAEPSYEPASGQPYLPGLGILCPSGLGQVFLAGWSLPRADLNKLCLTWK